MSVYKGYVVVMAAIVSGAVSRPASNEKARQQQVVLCYGLVESHKSVARLL